MLCFYFINLQNNIFAFISMILKGCKACILLLWMFSQYLANSFDQVPKVFRWSWSFFFFFFYSITYPKFSGLGQSIVGSDIGIMPECLAARNNIPNWYTNVPIHNDKSKPLILSLSLSPYPPALFCVFSMAHQKSKIFMLVELKPYCKWISNSFNRKCF